MVQLTLYHLRALGVMWEHPTKRAALPGSQDVRTTPRGAERDTCRRCKRATFRQSRSIRDLKAS